MVKKIQELNAGGIAESCCSGKAVLLAPILAVTNNPVFEALKNSTGVISYLRNSQENYKGAVQVLANKDRDMYYALFAGDSLSEAREQAKNLGLILKGDGFLKSKTLEDVNTYLGF